MTVYDIVTTVGLLLIIAIGVAAVAISRRYEGQHHRDSRSLWDELCKAHGLSRREARRLRSVAEQASLDPKSLIFVEPRLVRQLLDSASAEGSGSSDLHSRLFS